MPPGGPTGCKPPEPSAELLAQGFGPKTDEDRSSGQLSSSSGSATADLRLNGSPRSKTGLQPRLWDGSKPRARLKSSEGGAQLQGGYAAAAPAAGIVGRPSKEPLPGPPQSGVQQLRPTAGISFEEDPHGRSTSGTSGWSLGPNEQRRFQDSSDVGELHDKFHARMDELADQLRVSWDRSERKFEALWERCEGRLEGILARMAGASASQGAAAAPGSASVSTESRLLEVAGDGARNADNAEILQQMKQNQESLLATQEQIKALRSLWEDLKRAPTRSFAAAEGPVQKQQTDNSQLLGTRTVNLPENLLRSKGVRERVNTENSSSALSPASRDTTRSRRSNSSDVDEPQGSCAKCHFRMKKFGRSISWNCACIFMALLNALFCGILIDAETSLAFQQAKNPSQSLDVDMELELLAYDVTQIVFLAWLAVEMLVNSCAYGRVSNGYRTFKKRGWLLVFDFVVIVLVALELASKKLARLSFVKTFRILRLGRIVQAVRFATFFHGLHKMLVSLAASLITLLWAFFLMFLFMYIVGILMMQGVTTFVTENEVSSELLDDLDEYYGSFGKVILALFNAISGGDWRVFAEPLELAGWFYIHVWAMYIGFMVFGLLNILTGIFVDNAMKKADGDRTVAKVKQASQEEEFKKVIHRVFEHLDTDGSGLLTEDEFNELIVNRKVTAYLASIGVDARRTEHLFKVLDQNGSGTLSVDEVVEGCFQIHGEAKAIDVLTLLYDNRRLEKMMLELQESIGCARL